MSLKNILNFLRKLDEKSISYTISNPIDNSIMIIVCLPGQRWEVEFMEDGTIEIEKFLSNGEIYGEEEIEKLFENFSD